MPYILKNYVYMAVLFQCMTKFTTNKKKKELCIQNVLKDMGLDILLYNPGKRKNLGQMFVYTVWSQLCKLVKDNKEKI